MGDTRLGPVTKLNRKHCQVIRIGTNRPRLVDCLQTNLASHLRSNLVIPLRRFTALYSALVAFRLLLEHANEQARCQAKDGRLDDMPRVDNVDARDIIRHLQNLLHQGSLVPVPLERRQQVDFISRHVLKRTTQHSIELRARERGSPICLKPDK